MKTVSRFAKYFNKRFYETDGEGKRVVVPDGPALKHFKGFGFSDIQAILHFKDGLLHNDDGPAIEFADAHVEFWQNGVPHNEERNANGVLMPAIYSDYLNTREYWINGKQVSNPLL